MQVKSDVGLAVQQQKYKDVDRASQYSHVYARKGPKLYVLLVLSYDSNFSMIGHVFVTHTHATH